MQPLKTAGHLFLFQSSLTIWKQVQLIFDSEIDADLGIGI